MYDAPQLPLIKCIVNCTQNRAITSTKHSFGILSNLQISRFSVLIICRLESTGNVFFYLYKLTQNSSKTWSLESKSCLPCCVIQVIKNDMNCYISFQHLERGTLINFLHFGEKVFIEKMFVALESTQITNHFRSTLIVEFMSDHKHNVLTLFQ